MAAVGQTLDHVGDSRVTSRTMLITPQMAEEILATTGYEKQRRKRESHVNFLAGLMTRGQFLDNTRIDFAIFKGRKFQTDGQHRLHAVIKSGVAQSFLVVEREVDSMKEVAEIYFKTDRGRARSTRDTFTVFDLDQQLQLNKWQQDALASAIKVLMVGFDRETATTGVRIADEIILDAIHDWAEAARQYFSTVEGGDGAFGRRFYASPVLAVALVTFKFSPTKAKEFWSKIAQNDGLRKHSPEHAAATYLLTTRVQDVGVATYARKLASCWNAYLEGRTLSRVYGDKTRPIEIKGGSSPWRGHKTVKYREDGTIY